MTELIFIVTVVVVAGIAIVREVTRSRLVSSLSAQELAEEKNRIRDEYRQEVRQKADEIRQEFEERNQLKLEKMQLDAQAQLQKEEEKMHQRILDLQEKLDTERSALEYDRTELQTIKLQVEQRQADLEKHASSLEETYQKQLADIAHISETEAKELLLRTAKTQMGGELLAWQKKFLDAAQDDANDTARQIVALAVQQCSSEVANEFTITTVRLNEDNDKGKLIGKQGRNIQWLEKTLGVELVIDDTPEVITISGFSSVRRNIAKKTVEKLLADGRIHPASIEEMYTKARGEIAQEIADAGQWAVNELGIYDFPAKLVRLIGRLKFRTSYGQNMLKHSVEMAKLARLLAEEMNDKFVHREKPIDVEICVKGALLHDIGKAIDEETEPKGNHIHLGEKVCDTFGLDWRIRKCVSSHHDESYEDPEHGFCIEAVLVDACDNISGGRLGARKETTEAYFQRVEAMENIAEHTPGVNKAWIMRGSRELWVFFDTEKISPAQMHDITRGIAQNIQVDVKYPGEIKVVGMWEDKIVEYAR